MCDRKKTAVLEMRRIERLIGLCMQEIREAEKLGLDTTSLDRNLQGLRETWADWANIAHEKE